MNDQSFMYKYYCMFWLIKGRAQLIQIAMVPNSWQARLHVSKPHSLGIFFKVLGRVEGPTFLYCESQCMLENSTLIDSEYKKMHLANVNHKMQKFSAELLIL